MGLLKWVACWGNAISITAQAAAHKLIRHIPSHYDHEEQY